MISIICGVVKPDHEHNDDGGVIGWSDGETTEDTPENRKRKKEEGAWAQMESVACSICGSSYFERHAQSGFADDFED